MNRNVLTVVVAVAAAFGGGWAWSWFASPQTGRVAVVDLDEVAACLGRDEQMVESFKDQADELSQKLTAVKQNAVTQLEEIRKGLGESPTQEEAKNFIRLQQSANLQFNQRKQEADAKLGQHRQQLINRFREDAKPITEQVAKERGFSTVVTKNDSFVFAYDDGVDITAEVIQLMSAEMPARSATRTPAKPEPKANPATTQNSAGNTPTAAAAPRPIPQPASTN